MFAMEESGRMSVIVENIDIFWEGVKVTLWLTAISSVIALALGTILAALRVSPVPILRGFSAFYVEIVRNTPITIVFFFSAFVLPQMGVRFSYFTFAVIALSVYYASFFCEAIRSGINSVALGQAEAARSIGFTFMKSLRLIILPQALRTVVPPLISVFIALTKNTAVAASFGVSELLAKMIYLADEESTAILWILAATAIFYLAITVPAGALASHLENRLRFAR